MPFPSANPVHDKPSARFDIAGAGSRDPILAGFKGRLDLAFADPREALISWRIYSDGGFEHILTAEQDTDGEAVSEIITFGTHTDSGAAAVRNFVEWVTDRGTVRRQFWVKDLPTSDALYVNNQECQSGEAQVFINKTSPSTIWESAISLSINILPLFSDEFFVQQEYDGNRYANTRRGWGGAATAQIFLDGAEIVPEEPIDEIHGCFWEDATYGAHTLVARLRAARGSETYVDITGTVRVRQIMCP